ncbi:MAG: AAA family ATPase [Candidatus Poribacteria bacterium]|nr:AAA family ATPase [Candidatus Poribacteria bacterium]
MSAIDWITVKGLRSIKSIEKLELRPINVLIGPNGAGKSNLLHVFSLLNAISDGQFQNYISRSGGANRVLYFGAGTTQHLTIHISFENEKYRYEIKFDADDFDGMYPSDENAAYWDKERCPNQPYKEPLIGRAGEAGIRIPHRRSQAISGVRSHLMRWRVYHFHDTSSTSPLRTISYQSDNRCLRADGSNLASLLFRLREKHENYYDLILRTVRLVVPFFVLELFTLKRDKIRLEWRHDGNDNYFDAHSLSDATLRFIALATLLLQPRRLRPTVILLDEPELGLHPSTIAILASLIKQASVETQIVLATQSSLLLDHFDPDDVLVTNRVEGATQFTRLEGEKLKNWLKDYRLGELWEKNHFGGRPAPESENRRAPQ